MTRFKNHTGNVRVLKHKSLPILQTAEFDFYRCVQFNEKLYGKSVSSLNAGNLRLGKKDYRYNNLFPGQRLSYWADSPITARAEVKKWGADNNLLTFWGYDDGSSFIPTVYPPQELIIIDGFQMDFNKILKKLERREKLTKSEREMIDDIAYETPDCLAYESEARRGGTNFLFFEQGFRKISIREVWLRLGSNPGKNSKKIACAFSSDYMPQPYNYGKTFLPIARIGYDKGYINSDEYILRMQVVLDKTNRIIDSYNISKND